MSSFHPALIALLGKPVQHSASPLMHNTAFEAQDLNYLYVSHDVAGPELADAVNGMFALGYHGANITIPHKEAVRPFLVSESKRATAVGAVNTLIREKHGWRGDNTDVEGFLRPLEKVRDRVEGARMVVFGAGGASRAVVFGLLDSFAPERLTLAVRSPDRAQPLVKDMNAYDSEGALRLIHLDDAQAEVRGSQLVVNATPVGMNPHSDATPWQHIDDFSDQQIVYDLVYHPIQTKLLKQAATRGATCITGVDMLVAQAAAAYQMWTGREMPVDLVKQRILPTLT